MKNSLASNRKPVAPFVRGFLLALFFWMVFGPNNAWAEVCTPTYGGGQSCVRNKSFIVDKRVRKSNQNDWVDQVKDTQAGELVEFKLDVKNTGEVEVDNLRINDFLPDQLHLAEGNTEWEIDDFKPQQTKSFYLKARVADNSAQTNQELCVVNTGQVKYDGVTEASDSVVVCIEGPPVVTATVTPTPGQLPETAGLSKIGLLLQIMVGMGLVGTSLFINRFASWV